MTILAPQEVEFSSPQTECALASPEPAKRAALISLFVTVGAVVAALLGWLMMYSASYRLSPQPGRAMAAALEAAGGAATGFDTEAFNRGRERFLAACTACHGPDAKGLPNLGKDLVASEFVTSKTDAELLAFVKVGRPVWDAANTSKVDMPPKGGNPALQDDQILDIIAFIRGLKALSNAGK